LAKAFQKIHGGKKPPVSPKGAGSFSEWAYFHYGRWSFASRGWWIPDVKSKDSTSTNGKNEAPAVEDQEKTADQQLSGETADNQQSTGQEESGRTASSSETTAPTEMADSEKPLDKNDKRGEEDLNALAWFAQQNISGFVDWTKIEHPDFPEGVVEVGGFKPFYRLNPPAAEIDKLVQPHLDFLGEIEQVWPTLEFQDLKAVELAPGLYDVTCKLVNRGFLPTMPEMGRVNLEWYPIQVTLNVPADAKWIQGSRRQRVGKLDGQGGSEELRWLFQLPKPLDQEGTLSLETWSPTLHGIQAELQIKPAAATATENSDK